MVAHLQALYPVGIRALSRHGGRRLPEPEFYPCGGGWATNVNGERHLFDQAGTYISSGQENRFHFGRGPQGPQVRPLREVCKKGHEYGVDSHGRRRCAECRRASSMRLYYRNKAARVSKTDVTAA